MSFSLAVSDGDLVQQGSALGIVYGIDKIKQDLQLWVTEPYGGDRFFPSMGSILQDMIGGVIDRSTLDRVTNEVYRVLDNYQRVQFAALNKNPAKFSTSELLFSIDDVSARLGYDTVTVIVKVRSAASNAASITITQGL